MVNTLLVESMPEMQEFITPLLERHGDVDTADSAPEASVELMGSDYDMVFINGDTVGRGARLGRNVREEGEAHVVGYANFTWRELEEEKVDRDWFDDYLEPAIGREDVYDVFGKYRMTE
jgi:DNA-binding response OmpR family regulator